MGVRRTGVELSVVVLLWWASCCCAVPAQVSWDWQLESTVVYRGTQYLDHYLATHPVPALSKFQMLAISCLRTALKHSSKLAERERARLPCKHWAEVTDGACTEAEVRNTCLKLERMLQPAQRSHPNAKQRLRYLWYRLYDAGTVKQEHVYIYMLASFLLHLSLLDSTLSAVTPTKLATAALSLALKVFGFPPMPTVLAEHCFYLEGELQEVQAELARAQVMRAPADMRCCRELADDLSAVHSPLPSQCSTHLPARVLTWLPPVALLALRGVQEEVPGPQLRALWVQSYSYAGTHTSQQPAYTLLQHIVSNCGKLGFLPAASSSSSAKQEATAVLAAAPGAATAEAAAPAAAAGAAGEVAPEALAPASAAVNRVLTRAAAAAGLVSSQRKDLQQQSPAVGPAAAAAAAAVAAPLGEHASFCSGAGHAHASSSRGSAPVAAASLDADQGAVLATPQRPAAVSAGHMVPPMGPLPDFAAMAGALDAAATTPAATTSAAAGATAAGHAEGHSGLQLPSTGGSSRRCATRELPPRRAVAVSRYGMLACRGSNGTPARGTLLLGAPDGPSSSGRAGGASHVGVAAAATHQRTGAGSSSGLSLILPGTAAPAATTTGAGMPPGLLADGAGPSTFRAALAGAPAGPPAGSMTPASPKHAAAGTRGLAALFAGVGHGGAGSSQAGVGSNTGRLLSGLLSLQNKPNQGDSADLQRLSDEPSWLWPAQQHAAGSYGSHGGKAGPSSSSAQQHNSSVPVLRSARRAAAAAAAGGGGGGPSHQDLLQKMHERQGMHTRSSSGGGSSDGSNSHWHPMPGSAARSSQHHPMHD